MSEQDFGAECAEALAEEGLLRSWKTNGMIQVQTSVVAKIINDQLARRQPAPEPVAGEWRDWIERNACSFPTDFTNLFEAGTGKVIALEINKELADLFMYEHNKVAAALRHANAELSRCREALQYFATNERWSTEIHLIAKAALTPAPAPASSEVKS